MKRVQFTWDGKQYGFGSLLTFGNPKTSKHVKIPELAHYRVAILHLLPANQAGCGNLCEHASPGCLAGCLNTAGRGCTPPVHFARLSRTVYFQRFRHQFMARLTTEIRAFVRRCERNGWQPCVRLNGTSDVAWESIAAGLMEWFDGVVFYDYTKNPARVGSLRPNYSTVFSRSETNGLDSLSVLSRGGCVTVVMRGSVGSAKNPKPMIKTWKGFPVVDGDVHDLTFKHPPGHVIGLRAKGRATRDYSGFVIDV